MNTRFTVYYIDCLEKNISFYLFSTLTPQKMKYDEILQHVGEFGPYQRRVFYLLMLPPLLAGAQVFSVVFTMAIPEYR